MESYLALQQKYMMASRIILSLQTALHCQLVSLVLGPGTVDLGLTRDYWNFGIWNFFLFS